MSGGIEALSLKEEDATKMLQAMAHIGSGNINYQMLQYVYKRRPEGINIIDIRKTWEKLLLAARAIVAIEHPSDVFVISCRNFGQRAVLKFAAHTGATPIAGRFTPGAFTNQIQAAFREPRLLVVTDPVSDHQPITEASYVNIPVIAFCNTDSPLRFVDIAIPCNTQNKHSIGLMWWLLARQVLRLRGSIPNDTKWNVVVDLFFYRESDELGEKENENATKEILPAPKDFVAAETGPSIEARYLNGGTTTRLIENCADVTIVLDVNAPAVASADQIVPQAAANPGNFNTTDWVAQLAEGDWSATTAPAALQATNWGGTAAEKWT